MKNYDHINNGDTFEDCRLKIDLTIRDLYKLKETKVKITKNKNKRTDNVNNI